MRRLHRYQEQEEEEEEVEKMEVNIHPTHAHWTFNVPTGNDGETNETNLPLRSLSFFFVHLLLTTDSLSNVIRHLHTRIHNPILPYPYPQPDSDHGTNEDAHFQLI